MDDKELFESATTDEPIAVAETPVEPAAEPQGQLRDERGRFASQAEPEPQPEPEPEPQAQPVKDEAHVPSWRLREMREEREALQRQFEQERNQWQRQFAELQARLPQPERPKAPDVFEDPNGFLNHGVSQAVDPIKSEIGQLREFYSRKEAIREHGAEKVTAAYNAIAQGLQNRDPEASAVYQRAMQSMDPFGEIVNWHQQKTVFSQIGNDPNAWFERTLEERLKDQKFAGNMMQKIQQTTRQVPQGQSQVQLPPSLNRATSAAAPVDDDDGGEGGLLRSALRR